MGAVLGLIFAAGVLLAIGSGGARPTRTSRVRAVLDSAGLGNVRVSSVVAASVVAALAAAFLALALTGIPALGLIALLTGGALPVAMLARQGAVRRRRMTGCWPDAIDVLVSSVRAGLSLSEAVCELAVRGPEPLRPAAAQAARDLRAGAPLSAALGRLSADLGDPVADRVIETLRTAHEVGGRDLSHVLRTLGEFVREDIRTRSEIASRQSWTVNAARMAVAAPWVTVALMSARPGTVDAYRSTAGAMVLLVAAGLSALAYVSMQAIARLPQEERLIVRENPLESRRGAIA